MWSSFKSSKNVLQISKIMWQYFVTHQKYKFLSCQIIDLKFVYQNLLLKVFYDESMTILKLQ